MDAVKNKGEKIVKAVLPLSPENQIKYFKNKSILFDIDIENSRLTPKQCLMTLSNMRITAKVSSVSHELMKEYMSSRFVTFSTNLSKIMANILMATKHQRLLYVDVLEDFGPTEIAEFVVANKELLLNWCQVLDSIPLYLFTASQDFLESEEKANLLKNMHEVDEPLEGVGANLSQIVSIESFLSNYIDTESLSSFLSNKYFKYYFDEYIFGGQKLLYFLASKEHKSEFALQSFACMMASKQQSLQEQQLND